MHRPRVTKRTFYRLSVQTGGPPRDAPPDMIVGRPVGPDGPRRLAPVEVVLRPRWIWRVVSAGALALLAYVALVAAPADGENVMGLGFVACVVMAIFANVAAWRQHVRLERGVLYQQHTIRSAVPVPTSAIVGITLHRERGYREPWKHLLLRIWLPLANNRAYSRRWWSGWPELVVWLEANCTETGPDGVRRWTVATDDETQARLERVRHSVQSCT